MPRTGGASDPSPSRPGFGRPGAGRGTRHLAAGNAPETVLSRIQFEPRPTQDACDSLGDAAFLEIERGGNCDIIHVSRIDESKLFAEAAYALVGLPEDPVGEDGARDESLFQAVMVCAEAGQCPRDFCGASQHQKELSDTLEVDSGVEILDVARIDEVLLQVLLNAGKLTLLRNAAMTVGASIKSWKQ